MVIHKSVPPKIPDLYEFDSGVARIRPDDFTLSLDFSFKQQSESRWQIRNRVSDRQACSTFGYVPDHAAYPRLIRAEQHFRRSARWPSLNLPLMMPHKHTCHSLGTESTASKES